MQWPVPCTISSMKLGELATRLGAELRGDAELEVTGVKGIEEAGPSEITFVANPRYAGLARKTQAAAVLVEPEFPEIAAATLRIKNPYHAFSRALGLFYQPPAYPAGHSSHRGDRSDGRESAKAHISAPTSSSGPECDLEPTPPCCPTWCSTPECRRAATSLRMRMPWCARTACSATT